MRSDDSLWQRGTHFNYSVCRWRSILYKSMSDFMAALVLVPWLHELGFKVSL